MMIPRKKNCDNDDDMIIYCVVTLPGNSQSTGFFTCLDLGIPN